MAKDYDASAIEVLSGLEPVRRRPGMYTDTSRPNHLAHEVIDNSVDEAMAGHAKQVSVTINTDGSVTNGYANWLPLLATPAHPSYPSGHSGTINAGFEVLGTPPFTVQDVHRLVGEGAIVAINRAASEAGVSLTEEKRTLVLERFFAKYREVSAEGNGLYPGARELLTTLRARGVKTWPVSAPADSTVTRTRCSW